VISVVVPVFNEENTLEELTSRLLAVLPKMAPTCEIVFVDDGSTDRSPKIIAELGQKHNDVVRGIHFRRNFGKSFALKEGFRQAQGDIIFMMDADLQDLPEEMPKLHQELINKDLDAVSGWK